MGTTERTKGRPPSEGASKSKSGRSFRAEAPVPRSMSSAGAPQGRCVWPPAYPAEAKSLALLRGFLVGLLPGPGHRAMASEGGGGGGRLGMRAGHGRRARADPSPTPDTPPGAIPEDPVQGLRHGPLPARAPEAPVQGMRHGPLPARAQEAPVQGGPCRKKHRLPVQGLRHGPLRERAPEGAVQGLLNAAAAKTGASFCFILFYSGSPFFLRNSLRRLFGPPPVAIVSQWPQLAYHEGSADCSPVAANEKKFPFCASRGCSGAPRRPGTRRTASGDFAF
jgi:hypothetical protein